MRTNRHFLMLCPLLLAASGALAAVAPESVPLGDVREALATPARVAISPRGDVYVSEPQAGTIVVFDSFGRRIETVTGLGRPLGLAVDDQGRVYVGDEDSGSVGVYTPDWTLLYQLGIGTNQFALPGHIAIDTASGSNVVYVSDGISNRVSIFDGPDLRAHFGSAGTGTGQFDFAAGVCIGGTGEVYVVDQQNDRLQVFDRNGTFRRLFDFTQSGPGGTVFSGRLQGVLPDAAGRLFMVDSFQDTVRVIDAQTGAALTNFGSLGSSPGQLDSPAGAALDPLGRLFVTSGNNGRVELYGIDTYLHLTASPAAGVTAEGTNLILSVTGNLAGVTFQWRRDGTNLTDAGNVSGSTGAHLTVSNIQDANEGAYDVVLAAPGFAWTTTVTRVQVFPLPAVLTQPASQSVFLGDPVHFSVGVSGLPVTFQWLFNDADLDGETNGTLDLAAVEAWQAGDYAVRISNAAGVVQSDPATLTVIPVPTVMQIVLYETGTDGVSRVYCDADPFLPFALELSADFQTWLAVTNFTTESGIFEYVEPDRADGTNRFYRILWRSP